MLGPQPDPQPLAPPKDVAHGNPCQMGASDRGRDGVCLYQTTACTLHSAAHTPTLNPLTFLTCRRNQDSLGRGSEGYGTEEECVLSDPQGESDADADIEDTDSRLQEPGGLQRITSRRRKRPRPTRQDTTESEDDGGRSQRTPHWPLRLSPQRAHGRPILEESVSQVRPLVIRPARVEVQAGPEPARWSPRLQLLLLLLLPLSLLLLLLSLLFRPRAGA